jgi:hypothetical protein
MSVKTELARLARYDDLLSKVMPADFKDWHQNSKEEWPVIAAGVLENLRERLDDANQELDKLYASIETTADILRFR